MTDSYQPLTRVNGIGLWNSWTRNFKTPLLALLDLFDNSIDAAFVAPPSEPEGTAPGMLGSGDGVVVNGAGADHPQQRAPGAPAKPRGVSVSRPAASARAFRGKIHVESDEWAGPPDRDDVAKTSDGGTRKITGIKVINNSSRPIKSLGRIMEVYSSSKGRAEHGAITESHMHEDFAETIGENGVGLKQGCATLSDLSFVLMRNGERLGLAVIAARLQSPAGVYLPHVDFGSSADDPDSLTDEMMEFFEDEGNSNLRKCAEHYGEGDLDAGVGRLTAHFEALAAKDGAWGEDENVFCVVLHHLKHGRKTYAPKAALTAAAEGAEAANDAAAGTAVEAADAAGGGDVIEPLVEVDASDAGEATEVVDAIAVDAEEADDVDEEEKRRPPPHEPTPDERYADHALGLLQELRDELPRNYIHISSLMEVRVAGEVVKFHYWQRRLVELTSYTHVIDPVNSYTEAEDWKKPSKGYAIRLFCGFDSVRLTSDHHARGQCSLYIYSRLSGRLIKHEEDSRALLKLTSGGSHFSQGLTVIVDDAEGNLPLNPTKQDVAFGEQAHGDVHKRNLYSWLGAITSVYYSYHLDENCGSKKGVMTRKVRAFGTPVVDPARIRCLDTSDFTHMEDISWKLYQGGSIRIASKKGLRVIPGPDTVRRFKADPPRERVAPVRKRQRSLDDDTNGELAGGAKSPVPVTSSSLPSRSPGDVGEGLNGEFKPNGKTESHVITDDSETARLSMSPDAVVSSGGVKGDRAETALRRSKKRKVKRESTQSSVLSMDVESPPGEDDYSALRTEIGLLRQAVEKHRGKSQERKKVARAQDAMIKQLKAKVADLERVKKEPKSPGKKSTRELVLEEQCDQLAAALATAQETEEEQEQTIRELRLELKRKNEAHNEKLERKEEALEEALAELAALKQSLPV